LQAPGVLVCLTPGTGALGVALVDHFAAQTVDDLEPTELHNQLAAARNRAERPWAQQREGKQRLVLKVEQERAAFVQEHLGELAAAKEPAADAARERVEKALEEVEEAAREWQGVAQHFSGLLYVVEGIDGRDVPELSIDPVRLEVARARERGVPTPLPRSLYETEPADPTIRSAA
jgi:acyl-CoA reductase-like NAD-dependent aldehyde dehydrogenase